MKPTLRTWGQNRAIALLGSVLALALYGTACSSDNGGNETGHGGTTGTGNGGTTGSAGSPGHGGTTGSAGAPGNGGTTGSAGAPGHGGTTGTAGATAGTTGTAGGTAGTTGTAGGAAGTTGTGGIGGGTAGAAGGHTGGSGGGTAASGGTGGGSGAFTSVDPCTTQASYMTGAATNTIMFGGSLGNVYDKKCLKVPVGAMVTFSGSFQFHPLAPSPGRGTLTGNPITSTTSGTTATFTFPTAGYYGYYCTVHAPGDVGPMMGVVWVQ